MVSFNDTVSYVLYKNPVSQVTLAGLGQLATVTVSTKDGIVNRHKYNVT